MPTEQIMIRTGNCSEPPIEVNRPGVKLGPGDDILFKNQLNISGDKPTAVLKFYNLNDKPVNDTDPDNPIADFCAGLPGTEVPVPSTGPGVTCDPVPHGNFAYSISAELHDDLDPVLIIEDAVSLPLTAAIAAIIAAVAGFIGGNAFSGFNKKRQTEQH